MDRQARLWPRPGAIENQTIAGRRLCLATSAQAPRACPTRHHDRRKATALSSTADSDPRVTTASDREREPAEVAALWSAELPDLNLNPFLVSGTIMRLAARLERVFTATARARGVGPGELRILLALRRSGPGYALSPTALFRSLMITSGAVSKQVDRLEGWRLVQDLPCGIACELVSRLDRGHRPSY